MHNVKYLDLILRFTKELHTVGVTENMKKLTEDQYTRVPNVISAGCDETTDRFVYSHDGYMIEAVRTVKLTVKKCK